MASTFHSFAVLPQQQTSPAAIGSLQPSKSQQQGRRKEPQKPSGSAEVSRLTDEYNSAADQVAEQLDLCGIQKESLSSRARLNLQLLASIASTLQLADARPELILAAWAVLVLKESKAASLKCELQQERDTVMQKHAAAQAKRKMLQQVLQDVQGQQKRWAADVAKNTKLVPQLHEKEMEYRKLQQKLQRKLDAVGFTPEVTHAALLAKHEQVAELQQQLDSLQAKLQSYHNLPASMLGAQMMLQQAEERLKQQQAKLKARLADLH